MARAGPRRGGDSTVCGRCIPTSHRTTRAASGAATPSAMSCLPLPPPPATARRRATACSGPWSLLSSAITTAHPPHRQAQGQPARPTVLPPLAATTVIIWRGQSQCAAATFRARQHCALKLAAIPAEPDRDRTGCSRSDCELRSKIRSEVARSSARGEFHCALPALPLARPALALPAPGSSPRAGASTI